MPIMIRTEQFYVQPPWAWLQLLTLKYPGILWRRTEDESFTYFSEKRVPQDLDAFIEEMNEHIASYNMVESSVREVRKVDSIPEDAKPAYEAIADVIEEECPHILHALEPKIALIKKKLEQDVANGVDIQESRHLHALESLVFPFERSMRFSNCSSYEVISRIFLKDGRSNEYKQFMDLEKESYNAFRISVKKGSNKTAAELRNDVLRLADRMQIMLNEPVYIQENGGENDSMLVVYKKDLTNPSLLGSIFSQIRTFFYQLNMETCYDISWESAKYVSTFELKSITKSTLDEHDNTPIDFSVFKTKQPGYVSLVMASTDDRDDAPDDGRSLVRDELSQNRLHINGAGVLVYAGYRTGKNIFTLDLKFDLEKNSFQEAVDGIKRIIARSQTLSAKYRIAKMTTDTTPPYADNDVCYLGSERASINAKRGFTENVDPPRKRRYPVLERVSSKEGEVVFKADPIFLEILADSSENIRRYSNGSIADIFMEFVEADDKPDTFNFTGTLITRKFDSSFLGKTSPTVAFVRALCGHGFEKDIAPGILNGSLEKVFFTITDNDTKLNFEWGPPSAQDFAALGPR